MFDIPGTGRVGLSICYDAWFPETTRQLAWMGAELVLNRANAIANQVFVASVNAAAPTGVGCSLLADPQGTVRSAAPDANAIRLTDVIDLDEVTNVRTSGTCGLNRVWGPVPPRRRAGAATGLRRQDRSFDVEGY